MLLYKGVYEEYCDDTDKERRKYAEKDLSQCYSLQYDTDPVRDQTQYSAVAG
jgi:hypothetical protein